MVAENRVLTTAQVIYFIFNLILYPALLLLLSGDWTWVEGWIFSIFFVVMSLFTTVYLYRHDPELLKERFKRPGTGGQKGWDRYFIYVLMVSFLAWFIIMPLDAKRFEWTGDFPIWLKVLGGFALLVSFFFMFRSFADNPYASHLVRIQTERKQHVVSTGVYGFVRHPMYLGGMLLFIGAPLLLGSGYGILIGAAMSLLLVGRIIGEEKMLVEELEGYDDYRKKVRYRLIPFVW